MPAYLVISSLTRNLESTRHTSQQLPTFTVDAASAAEAVKLACNLVLPGVVTDFEARGTFTLAGAVIREADRADYLAFSEVRP